MGAICYSCRAPFLHCSPLLGLERRLTSGYPLINHKIGFMPDRWTQFSKIFIPVCRRIVFSCFEFMLSSLEKTTLLPKTLPDLIRNLFRVRMLHGLKTEKISNTGYGKKAVFKSVLMYFLCVYDTIRWKVYLKEEGQLFLSISKRQGPMWKCLRAVDCLGAWRNRWTFRRSANVLSQYHLLANRTYHAHWMNLPNHAV